ncbi:MAG: hypothetical protein AB7I27_01685 [Bacteriovoracaceae bacterium]
MKNNLGSDYFLLAHVDLSGVHFYKKGDLGIEFTNEIDAWSKMMFKFRNTRSTDFKYAQKDLTPFIYSVRSRLE